MGLTAQALLAKKPAHHPLFLEIAEMFVQTEIGMCKEHPRWRTERK
jgi:hypothetical protein